MARCQRCQGTAQQPWVVCWAASLSPWRYIRVSRAAALGLSIAARGFASRHFPLRALQAGDCYRRGITWGFSATGRLPKMSDNPRRLAGLKNGNPRGNPANSPRCGAKTRIGSPCRQPAMKNGRCRLHGGKSPGAPRGERNGNYRHGLRTIEAAAQRREAAAVRSQLRRVQR